jgi:hypothetical protein
MLHRGAGLSTKEKSMVTYKYYKSDHNLVGIAKPHNRNAEFARNVMLK